MPYWLTRQLKQAFYNKDHRQIAILNDCWYMYHNTYSKQLKDQDADASIEENST